MAVAKERSSRPAVISMIADAMECSLWPAVIASERTPANEAIPTQAGGLLQQKSPRSDRCCEGVFLRLTVISMITAEGVESRRHGRSIVIRSI